MPTDIRAQFSQLDRFVVVNSTSNIAVEGAHSGPKIQRACRVLNEQELRHGRQSIYDVRPIPPRLYNQEPGSWQSLLDQGGEVRQVRVRELKNKMRVNYPSRFVILANQKIAQVGDAQAVDWTELHDIVLMDSIDDVRGALMTLRQLLHESPGAVTRAEQDLLCSRLQILHEQHIQSKGEESPDSSGHPSRPRG